MSSGLCIEQAIILVELCRTKKNITAKSLKDEYEKHGIKRTIRTCQRHLCLAETHIAIQEWRERDSPNK